MNRQKKKVSHSSEDQVSIFDSEEEEDKRHKKKEHKEHKEKSIRKGGNRGNEKVKRTHHKIREKKLVKEEEIIMKQLMGKDEKSHEQTESERNQFEVKVEERVENQGKRQHKQPQRERQLFDPYQQEWIDDYAYFNETTNLTNNMHNQFTETTYVASNNFDNNPSTFTSNGLYYCTPDIDPSIELYYEDFEEEIHQAAESNLNSINSKEIEDIKRQIEYQQRVEARQNMYKRDKRFKEQRKAFIIEELERLKKEFVELEDQQEDPIVQNEDKRLANESYILLRDWKYDPSILAKKEKPASQSVKTSEQDPPKSKTEGRIVMLNDVLAENPFLTQVQMADVLRAIDPVMNARIQRSVVLRILKMCGFKKKKVRGVSKQRNTTQSINMRFKYALKYREYLSAGFKCFFFDELIINEYFDKQSGWCKSQGDIQFKPEKYMDRSVVVLALLSLDGTCKWQVKFGDYEAEPYCKKISSMLKKSGQGVQRKLLIVNPLPYRNPRYFTEITRRRGWEMLVLPSDGLGLNPLQSYFAQIRQTMKRKRFDTIQTLFECVVQVLTESDKQQLGKKMNSRIEGYIDKALRKQQL